MEHVVFFPATDGTPTFRRVPSLEEAVRLVEHLRNAEGLSSVSVHALTEVPLAFRAYYRVEVPVASVPVQHPLGAGRPVEARPVLEPVPVPAVAPAGLVLVEDLVEDLDEDEAPLAVQDSSPVEDRSAQSALATPASLGFFA